jgi:hypothetical protein
VNEVRCDKCGEELDFAVMKRQNFLETGETHLTVWVVFQNTPKIEFRDGIQVRTGSFDLLGIFTESERAYEIKDMQNSYWEDRCMKSERPKVYVEEVQINHHWAWRMFQEMLEPRNLHNDMLCLYNKQDWEKIIGEVDLAVLDNETVMKLLLKYASTKEKFYIRDFIAEMDIPKDIAIQCAELLVNGHNLRYYEIGE